jgi:hypothetical protein
LRNPGKGAGGGGGVYCAKVSVAAHKATAPMRMDLACFDIN